MKPAVISVVLAAAVAVVLLPVEGASARPNRAKAHAASRAKPMPQSRPRPAAPQDDQSYLYGGPLKPQGTPDYVANGSKPFNQPWFMGPNDRIGSW